MVGHDRDGVVEAHDLTHALDRLGRRIIHALHPAAEDGRLCEGRDLHARRPNVDAVDGRSIDLRGRVQTLGRGADELEIRRRLERDILGNRQLRGSGCKSAVLDPATACGVDHLAPLGATGCRFDLPFLGGRRHQHGSRGRTGLAERLPRGADRVRVAGCLHAGQQRISVQLFVRRSMLQPHLFQLHLQLFGDQHRDGGIGALAHLHIGHGQDDLPIGRDADEGVGREAIGAGRLRFAICERQGQAQHQAAARGRSGPQEAAPGETVH